MHQYDRCRNTPMNLTILYDLKVENMRSTCCFVNNMVVCWTGCPKDCEVLFMVLDFPDTEATWEFFIPDDRLICGLIRVLLRFVWVSDEVDCFGGSGARGITWEGNYW